MLRITGGLAECSTMAADLLSSTYKDNIKAFNDQFQKAKKILEGTLSMDQYQLVVGIGSSVSRRLAVLSFIVCSPGHDAAKTWCGRRGVLEIRRRMS